jgi:D-serine deaminase-like pyridoxal phosphate-dependent protein
VLVELGLSGKRAGCRTPEEAMTVARAVEGAPGLLLAGFEGYEGLLDDRGRLRASRTSSRAVRAGAGSRRRRLVRHAEILVTAGGSGFFDLVARGFQEVHGLSRPCARCCAAAAMSPATTACTRSSCGELDEREGIAPGEGLRPALEIWSVVQSRPEPGLAILTMGKRDASHDAGLPVPLWTHRPGPGAPHALPAGCEIVKMNDQHAYLRLPEGDPIRDAWRSATWSAAASRIRARPSTAGRCCWRWTTITRCAGPEHLLLILDTAGRCATIGLSLHENQAHARHSAVAVPAHPAQPPRHAGRRRPAHDLLGRGGQPERDPGDLPARRPRRRALAAAPALLRPGASTA